MRIEELKKFVNFWIEIKYKLRNNIHLRSEECEKVVTNKQQ